MRFAALILVGTISLSAGNSINQWTYDNGYKVSVGTVSSCNENVDQFPDKVAPLFAKYGITYKNTYKIVENKVLNKKYVLYQRGCSRPAAADGQDIDGVFEIPLSKVYMSSSTYFGFMELMGERSSMRIINGLYSSSPCLHRQVSDGWTKNAPFTNWCSSTLGYCDLKDTDNNATTPNVQVPNEALNALKIEGSFCTTGLVCKNPIMVSDISENNFYAAGEWIEYFSVFFNREAIVGQFADTTRQRWVTSSEFAMSIQDKKRVLFVSYWKEAYPAYGTYKGWEVKTCDPSTSYTRYCELVKAAGAIAVNSDTSALAVFDFGRKADPSGGTEWLAGGQLQPDALLLDVIKSVYPDKVPKHEFVFMRNLLDSVKSGSLDCANVPTQLGCPMTGKELIAKCTDLSATV
ncbi:hypothetical protein GUITHDRAFT_166586, partial [Guillardia theta CCMP2712]